MGSSWSCAGLVMKSDDVKSRLELYVKRLQLDIRTIHKLLDKCDEVPGGSYIMCVTSMDKCWNRVASTMGEIGVQIEYPKHQASDTECPPGTLSLSDVSMLVDERRLLADVTNTPVSDPFDW